MKFSLLLACGFVFFICTMSGPIAEAQVKKKINTDQLFKPQTFYNPALTNSDEQSGAVPYNQIQSLIKPASSTLSPQGLSSIQEWIKKCGTVELDRQLRNIYPGMGSDLDFEQWMGTKIKERKDKFSAGKTQETLFTIPIIVHILHNGEPVGIGDNVPEAQVLSQIKVLNQDFRRLNSDASQTPSFFEPVAADIEIEFRLATVDPDGIPLEEPGIDRSMAPSVGPWTIDDINNTIKPSTIWDPERYLNVWVIDLGDDVLGYATFPTASGLPGLNFTPPPANLEGVVLRNTAFGSNFSGDGSFDLLAGNDRGRTTTHEIGHFLGLRHIWGDGDCSEDDFVSDTPDASMENFVALPNCGQGVNSCDEGPGDLPDMVQNYMDFSFDGCMNLFTLGQKDRIRTVLENSPRRMELTTSNTADPVDEDAVFASFSTSALEICQGESVTFTDFSEAGTNTTISDWDWQFDVDGLGGASIDNANTEGPHAVTFNTPGEYVTSLTVTGASGSSDQVIKNIKVISREATSTLPDNEGFENEFPPENWSIQNEGFITWSQVSIGARGSENSTFINNFSNNLTGLTNITLTTPSYDLSGVSDAFLYFDVAYAAYLDSDNGDEEIFDDLAIVYSTNCGIDFNELLVLTGEELATGEPVNEAFIPLMAEDWKNIQIDLSDFPGLIGEDNVTFGLSNRGNFGNLLFVDNVVVSTMVDQLPTVANPIEDIVVFINSADSTISIADVFTDEDNDDNLITISVIENSNPGLVSTSINGSDLVFSFVADQFGSSVITLEGISNGQAAVNRFLVRVLSDFDVIYSQGAVIGTSFPNSEFSDLGGILQNADDFTVPTGAIYAISEVYAPGFFSAGSSEAPTALSVAFYEDDNGAPGNVIYTEKSDLFGTLSLSDTAMVFPLATTVELTEGTYWMSIYPEMDLSTGLWNWFESVTDEGQSYQVRDELDLLGGGFTDWTSMILLRNRKFDLAFELRGVINGEIPPKAPTGLVGTSISDTQVDLEWVDNSDNETGFIILRSTEENGPFEEVGNVPIDVTSFSDVSIASDNACEVWFYKVIANKSPTGSAESNTAAVASKQIDIPPFTGFEEDFEGSFPPDGWEILNLANGGIGWEQGSIGFGEMSVSSLIIDNYNNDLSTQAPGIIALPSFDFTGIEDLFMSFDVASAAFLGSDNGAPVNIYDSLVIAYSVDCGLQYTIIETLSGETLETGAPNSDQFVPADDNEWKNITVNLGAISELSADTLENVRFAIANFANFAQTLYIDNIVLSETIDIAAPTELSGVAQNGTEINLIWQDNATNENGYVIERSDNDNSNFVQIDIISANSRTFTDTDIQEDITYFYRIRAINGNSSSDYSNIAEVYNEPLGIDKALLKAIKIFPNPTKGQVNITMEGYDQNEVELKVISPVGQLISTDSYSIIQYPNGLNIDLSGQSSGIYIIHLKTKDGIVAKRVLSVK